MITAKFNVHIYHGWMQSSFFGLCTGASMTYLRLAVSRMGSLDPFTWSPTGGSKGALLSKPPASDVCCQDYSWKISLCSLLRQSSSSTSAQSWILTPIISSSSVIWIVTMQLPCHGNWEGVYMVFGMVFLKRWIEFLTMFENCNIFSGVLLWHNQNAVIACILFSIES